MMEPPPQPDLVRVKATDGELGAIAGTRIDVQVQLADRRWARAEIVAEGLDAKHGWRILLRWSGGYQAWFIPDPAKFRRVTEGPDTG
jgi:hypothetical protein